MKLIQPPTPVPDSKIWNLSDEFYAGKGAESWSRSLVPQRVTSNCYIADVYASITAAFFRDLARQGCLEPPLIIEVGGGSGLFAWQFLHRLLNHHLPNETDVPNFNYLLTDGAASNIANWKTKQRFAPLRESGLLDFGILWVKDILEIKTSNGRTLSVNDLGNRPVVLITNYLYCSIPCDLYRVRDHEVYRELIALYERDQDPVEGDAGAFQRIKATFSSEARSAPFTGHARIDRIIEGYRALPGDACIPVPEIAIRFLEIFLRRNAPLLNLASDIGYTEPLAFPKTDPFILGQYLGYYTNFHMMGEIFREYGGAVQGPAFHDRTLPTVALMLPGSLTGLPETMRVARTSLENFTPYDAYNVLKTVRKNITKPNYLEIAAWLRLSKFDPLHARKSIPLLLEVLGQDKKLNVDHVREMFLDSYRAYFPDGGATDEFDIEIAHLFLRLDLHEDARELLERGAAEFGRTALRLYVLALALISLDRIPEGEAAAHESVRADKEFEPAQKLVAAFREGGAMP
ncbi:MAG TPA: hypothetical protein VGH65_01730 [Verrucomicrobiaceae bacterium]